VARICEAVHHAHQRGIIHRDLKPGSILVDETGEPRILDFGVARVVDSDAQARQTDVGQLVSTLALIYERQGEYAQAESLATDTLRIKRRVLGEEHPDTLITMSNLAAVYEDQGKYAQAEPLQLRVLETRRRVLGEDHPSTLLSMQRLGRLYRRERKYSQAESIVSEVLAVRRRKLGALHRDTLVSLAALGDVRLARHKYREAELSLREAVESREKITPDSWERYQADCLLGASLAGQKKYAAAEPLLLSGYQGLVRRAATIPAADKSVVELAEDWIVKLYRDWGKPEEAARWRARLKAGTAQRE
jgi:eukaryotic-like serine/threonine-protein kinase